MDLDKAYRTMQKASGIEVGDTIKVLRKADDHEMGWGEEWLNTEMDKLVGKEFVVADVSENSGFLVKIEGDDWFVPFFVCELMKKREI